MSTTPRLKQCAHCEASALHGYELCEVCLSLPRCEICEVIFGGLVNASSDNPNRCDSCLDYEEYINLKCSGCEKPIPIYTSKKSGVTNYVVRGNWCPTCNQAAKKRSIIASADIESSQFVGYLALLKALYDGGKINKGEWERSVRANPHDVKSWIGIEDLMDDEDDYIRQDEADENANNVNEEEL